MVEAVAKKCLTPILCLTLVLACMTFFNNATAQPTWNFKVVALPADLYPGEWGEITFNITNMDCNYREDYNFLFKWFTWSQVDEMVRRSAEMFAKGLITDYRVDIERSYVGKGPAGRTTYYDGTLRLKGVCRGRSIEVLEISVWFQAKGMGKSQAITVPIGERLDAFNPVRYITQGSDPFSSTSATVKVFIPSDLAPEDLKVKPSIDIKVHYPEWVDYTFENYPIAENYVEIQPYRSFNLTITDYSGVIPLSMAKLIIVDPKSGELIERTADDQGRVSVRMLPEDQYEVRVCWTSKYSQPDPCIHRKTYWAYELASMKVLKIEIFTATIEARDLHGRLLENVKVVFDGFEKETSGGRVDYHMVPQGNHSLQVFWRGQKLYEGWVWIGFTPGSPQPVTTQSISLPIGDLLVQAVDSGGKPVGATFTVADQGGKIIAEEVYSETGLLNISQLLVKDYLVRAVNVSTIHDTFVTAEGVFKPGKLEYLQLPIYSISFKIVNQADRPVQEAVVRLNGLDSKTGADGAVTFAGIPRGSYDLEVEWRGVNVYKDTIEVSGAIDETIRAKIYDVDAFFLNSEGEPVKVTYMLRDPAGREFTGEGEAMKVQDVPEGECDLIVLYDGAPILQEKIQAAELAGMKEIALPIFDMEVTVRWSDGSPLEGARIEVIEVGGLNIEQKAGEADVNGVVMFEGMPASTYLIKVYYPNTGFVIANKTVGFKGQKIEYSFESTGLTIKVIDPLGNPVQGAEVTVSYLGLPIAYKKTTFNGVATFMNIVRLPAYEVHVSVDNLEATTSVQPGGYAEVQVSYITGRSLMTLVAIIAIIGVIAAIAIILVRRSSKREM